MSDRCKQFRKMSPGGRDMAISSVREEHQAWTRDNINVTCEWCDVTADWVEEFCDIA